MGEYVTDWAYVRRATVAAAGVGAVCGGVIGAATARGGKGALLAGVQAAVFAGSFFVVREGFRHAARVESWKQDWAALNGLSCATGAALVGMVRAGWRRQVFVRSFIAGALVGLTGSALWVLADRMVVAKEGNSAMEKTTAMTEEEKRQADKGWLPSWSPFRRISKEEIEERQKRF